MNEKLLKVLRNKTPNDVAKELCSVQPLEQLSELDWEYFGQIMDVIAEKEKW